MAEISNEALEKLGVSGGAGRFGEGLKNLSAAEKATVAAMVLGAGAGGAGIGVLGANKHHTGNWLGGKTEEPKNWVMTKNGNFREATEAELKNADFKKYLTTKSFAEQFQAFEKNVSDIESNGPEDE